MIRSRPPPVDWRLTAEVRRAVRDDRVVVSDHAEAAALAVGLTRADLLAAVTSGVVLSRRQRDEKRTAVDGYKHFLDSLLPSGVLIEVVFKFVRGREPGTEQLVLLITVYKGTP